MRCAPPKCASCASSTTRRWRLRRSTARGASCARMRASRACSQGAGEGAEVALPAVARARPRRAGTGDREGRRMGRATSRRSKSRLPARAASASCSSSSPRWRTASARARRRSSMRSTPPSERTLENQIRAVAEDAGGRPARRRHRARLQQRALRHHDGDRPSCSTRTSRPIRRSRTSCRSSRTPTARPRWCGSCSPSRAGRRCGRRCSTSASGSAISTMLLKRLIGEKGQARCRARPRPVAGQGRHLAIRAGHRQSRGQCARRHAGRRQTDGAHR